MNIACPQYVPGYLFFQWDNFCWRIPNVYLFIIYKVCLLFHEEGPRQVEDRRPSYLSFEGQKWCTCACLRNDPLLRPVRIAQFPIERVVWQTTQMTFGHGWSRKSPPWKKYENKLSTITLVTETRQARFTRSLLCTHWANNLKNNSIYLFIGAAAKVILIWEPPAIKTWFQFKIPVLYNTIYSRIYFTLL